ncbi:MAG: SCO family protein [Balneolaceae bacterium]
MFRWSIYLKWMLSLLLMVLIISGCGRLSIKDSFTADEKYELVDQDSSRITFPDNYQGDILLVGYVYTHCPDICPVITYNMRDVKRSLGNPENFTLISISFDPDRDTPDILYNYAESYRIDQENWRFLTGNPSEVDRLLNKLEVSTLKSPTRFNDNDTPVYFIDHTDRVTLIDREGNIRAHYHGSELDPEQVAEDINYLLTSDKKS